MSWMDFLLKQESTNVLTKSEADTLLNLLGHSKYKQSYFEILKSCITSLMYESKQLRSRMYHVDSFWRNYYFEASGNLEKLRSYYLRGKSIRKEQHSEILRLRAKVRSLRSKKESRLELIGYLVSGFPPNINLTKNSRGKWVVSAHDEDSQMRIIDYEDYDLLKVLRSIQ